ncbi:hypothetical protein C8R47DRAFT_1157842 [Mycena vitilis]|nr:hypothetical protein C8R47DRAFT_1157842 [Mycena vitilis]
MESSPSLPDEVISEILSPALKVPDDMFAHNDSGISPFATYNASSSAVLLVCKAWLRVATPLLYNVVVLRSKAQAKALERALIHDGDLGRWIKRLRLEGAYGTPMHAILQSAPNVTDLFLSLDISAADNTCGLCTGLPLINPKRFILQDSVGFKNKMLANLMSALEKCFLKWDKLEILDIPTISTRSSKNHQRVLNALKTSETLHTVIIPFEEHHRASSIVRALEGTSLRAIQIKKPIKVKPILYDFFLRDLHQNPSLLALVKYTIHNENPAQASVPQNSPGESRIMPANPSFIPLHSASKMVRDHCWSRVLYYAMSIPELNSGMSCKDIPRRLSLLLVSKTFYTLGLQYYYSTVHLKNSKALSEFSCVLLEHPDVGAKVRSVHGTSMLTKESTGDLLTILTRTTRLEQFRHCCDDAFKHSCFYIRGLNLTDMAWASFEIIANSLGSSLREFSGEIDPSHDPNTASMVLHSFTELTSLDWKCCTKFGYISQDVASYGGLQKLTDLRIWYLDQSFLTVLASMPLPSLRRLSLSRHVEDATKFLESSGSTLFELNLDHKTLKNLSINVFVLCPHLTVLSVHCSDTFSRMPYLPVISHFVADDQVHEHLTKINIELSRIRKENIEPWGTVFSAIQAKQFPSLREVYVECCKWPKTEREIKKSHWVRWAERFMKDGINMVNKDGRKWGARLGRV